MADGASPWGRTYRELSIYECAVLNGGRKLAVRAALANLLAQGTIERTLNGYRTVTTELPSDPLEHEIANAAKLDPRVDILIFWMCRGDAMKSLVQTLRADGFLKGAGHGPLHPLSGPTAAGEEALAIRRSEGPYDIKLDPAAAIAMFGTDELCKQDPDLALQLGIAMVGGNPQNAWGNGQF